MAWAGVVLTCPASCLSQRSLPACRLPAGLWLDRLPCCLLDTGFCLQLPSLLAAGGWARVRALLSGSRAGKETEGCAGPGQGTMESCGRK